VSVFTVVTVLAVLASVGLPAAVVALVRRGRAANTAWADAIAEHVAATGDLPTVAEWRAGRLRRPRPPEPDPVPTGPATVTVTVVAARRAELPGGVR
jgi:hypothetical protein